MSSREGPDSILGSEPWRLVPAGWEDGLTGLPGPTFWRTILAAESARAARYHRPITVVLVEISGLSVLASNWGDDVAVQALIAIGRVLRAASRTSDYVTRLDGARFGVILTETDEVAAINFVERVRERCERKLGGTAEERNVALGWASPTGPSTLIEAADQAEARLLREQGRAAGGQGTG